MRDQTEWVELIENNVNTLVGADNEKIVFEAKKMMNQESDFSIDLYGSGKACENITNELLRLLH